MGPVHPSVEKQEGRSVSGERWSAAAAMYRMTGAGSACPVASFTRTARLLPMLGSGGPESAVPSVIDQSAATPGGLGRRPAATITPSWRP